MTPRTPYRAWTRTVTIDTLAARLIPAGPIALLKIDAENAELDILRGAVRTLPRVRAVIAACYHATGEVRRVRSFLVRQGYTTTVQDGIVVGDRGASGLAGR